MNQTNSTISNRQLTKNIITRLNIKLTKKGKDLLVTLYNCPHLKHKDLAATLDMQSSGLTNLISRINTVQKDLIESKSEGRCKFHYLSQIAETYTETILLPEEAKRKGARTSAIYNDPLINNVRDSLKKFQEIEGDDWDMVLDDLLFVETRNKPAINTESKEGINQNYANFKNALISLITQHGKTSVQNVYDILDQNILRKRLDALLSNILDDFFKMEPLFHLEKEDPQMAYSIIDNIFTECFPKVFESNPASYLNPLPPEYIIHSVIIKMANEFMDNHGNKAVAIALWEKKFHTRNHFSCISYIAEKCSTIYMRQKSVPPI